MKLLENIVIKEKNILLRVDLNIPTKNGLIIDKTRIDVLKPTINYLRKNNNKIFLLSHFGRPGGKFNSKFSLNFLCQTLAKSFLVKEIFFVPSLSSNIIKKTKHKMQAGDICLLENIRFYIEEETNKHDFANELASSFDVYVNDAFSASHRNHASITGVTKFLPAVAGLAFSNEVRSLNKFLTNPKKPTVAIIGGSKVSTKLSLLQNLIKRFDKIIIGGAMANTFLLAKGNNIGKSLIESNLIEESTLVLEESIRLGSQIILPFDVVCADSLEKPKKLDLIEVSEINDNQIVLDIGKQTIKLIKSHLIKARTILWNGPLGVFETKPFDNGTVEIANIIKQISLNNKIVTVAGGGDTIAAIKQIKAQDSFSYISSAGGAFLEWIEGNESPGVNALKENNKFYSSI